MQKLCIAVLGCFVCGGCSEVPSLEAASGTDQPKLLMSDIVQRVKCEIADAFDDKITNPDFQWLQDWTAKVDLTLQVNDTAGVSPSGSYTKFYKNAFNTAAGSQSLTNVVIASVSQSFTLTAGANYSEQAQRSETTTFTLSLREVKTWRKNMDQYLRRHYGADAADHFCEPSQRELRGNLGLKEWINSALYPVSLSELQAGIHPQPGTTAKAPPSPSPHKRLEEEFATDDTVTAKYAKEQIDPQAKAAGTSADNANAYAAAVARSLARAQNSTAPYLHVLTAVLREEVTERLNDLKVNLKNAKDDADHATQARDKVQSTANEVNSHAPTDRVKRQLVTDAEASAADAKAYEEHAKTLKDLANKIATNLVAFKPNPPVDGLGHSVQFIVTYGGSVTPNWSLLMWKGPGLTLPGASLSGVRTNILNIAVGPSGAPTEQNRLLLNQTLQTTLFRPQ